MHLVAAAEAQGLFLVVAEVIEPYIMHGERQGDGWLCVEECGVLVDEQVVLGSRDAYIDGAEHIVINIHDASKQQMDGVELTSFGFMDGADKDGVVFRCDEVLIVRSCSRRKPSPYGAWLLPIAHD